MLVMVLNRKIIAMNIHAYLFFFIIPRIAFTLTFSCFSVSTLVSSLTKMKRRVPISIRGTMYMATRGSQPFAEVAILAIMVGKVTETTMAPRVLTMPP